MFYQYQTIKSARNLNPVIKAGMTGVILDIWDDETFEVEFLDNEGINYEYEGQYTFTVKTSDISEI